LVIPHCCACNLPLIIISGLFHFNFLPATHTVVSRFGSWQTAAVIESDKKWISIWKIDLQLWQHYIYINIWIGATRKWSQRWRFSLIFADWHVKRRSATLNWKLMVETQHLAHSSWASLLWIYRLLHFAIKKSIAISNRLCCTCKVRSKSNISFCITLTQSHSRQKQIRF